MNKVKTTQQIMKEEGVNVCVCVCAFILVCICVWAQVHVCASVPGGQRTATDVILQIFLLSSHEIRSLMTWNLTSSLSCTTFSKSLIIKWAKYKYRHYSYNSYLIYLLRIISMCLSAKDVSQMLGNQRHLWDSGIVHK